MAFKMGKKKFTFFHFKIEQYIPCSLICDLFSRNLKTYLYAICMYEWLHSGRKLACWYINYWLCLTIFLVAKYKKYTVFIQGNYYVSIINVIEVGIIFICIIYTRTAHSISNQFFNIQRIIANIPYQQRWAISPFCWTVGLGSRSRLQKGLRTVSAHGPLHLK